MTSKSVKDLLEHNPFKTAKILTPTEFEKQLAKWD